MTAVDGEILGLAKGKVQRVVDAAEAEAFRDLCIEARGVAPFVTRDDARRESVRRRGSDAVDRIREDAVEHLLAILFEVVVAETAGQIETVADAEGHLAEQRQLARFVVQVRLVELVLQSQLRAGRGDVDADRRGRVLEADHRQVLAVVAVGAAVEDTGHPLEPLATAVETELLGVALRLRGVEQRCVDAVDTLGQTDAAAGDAGRERGRIADDEDVAIGVRGDRGQGQATEVVLEIEIAEEELVGERLLDLDELLAIAEVHGGPGGGERIGEDVEVVDAIPAVHLHFLIEDARRDREPLVRLEAEGHASAETVAVVDVVAHAQSRLHGVDEAAVLGVVRGRAHRRAVADRHVHRGLHVAADASVADRADAQLTDRLGRPELRLIGDVTDGSRQRAGAEQRSLGPAQDLDAGDVEEVDVGGEQRERDHGLVEVHADLFLHARLIADDLPGRNAAHRDLTLSGAEVLHGESGDVHGHVFDRLRAEVAQFLLGGRGDGHRNVVHVLLALAGRDDHLLGNFVRLLRGGLFSRGRLLLRRREQWQAQQDECGHQDPHHQGLHTCFLRF